MEKIKTKKTERVKSTVFGAWIESNWPHFISLNIVHRWNDQSIRGCFHIGSESWEWHEIKSDWPVKDILLQINITQPFRYQIQEFVSSKGGTQKILYIESTITGAKARVLEPMLAFNGDIDKQKKDFLDISIMEDGNR